MTSMPKVCPSSPQNGADGGINQRENPRVSAAFCALDLRGVWLLIRGSRVRVPDGSPSRFACNGFFFDQRSLLCTEPSRAAVAVVLPRESCSVQGYKDRSCSSSSRAGIVAQ
jgi:hypothetical protein